MKYPLNFSPPIPSIRHRVRQIRTALGLTVLGLTLLLALSSPAAHAQNWAEQTIHSFSTSNGDGFQSYGNLTAVNGLLYGTTSSGGNYNEGTVFAMNPATQTETILHSFNGSDGAFPMAGLVNVNGTLYGTTTQGGAGYNGTVFAVKADGTGFQTLYGFGTNSSDGQYAAAALVAVNGILYGTTQEGGAADEGTVFSLDPATNLMTVIHSFIGLAGDGFGPYSSLMTSNGILYGTTVYGGMYNKGTVFAINIDGTSYQTLSSFSGSSGDGAYPVGGLLTVGGLFYGTTQGGGTNNKGTVFAFDPTNNQETPLYRFSGSADGAAPFDSLIAVNGTLYGTTVTGGSKSNGTVFSYDPTANVESTIHQFTGAPGDGSASRACLINMGGTLYGTTGAGGSLVSAYGGTVFALTSNNVSTPPVAADDGYPVTYGTAYAAGAPGVLANDNAEGSGKLTPALVSNVSHGTLTLSADGSFTYTPTAGFVGADRFTYQDTNSAGTSNTATVTLNVQAAIPTAANDSYPVNYQTALAVTTPGVLGNDSANGSSITPALVSNVSHGSLTFSNDGSFTYTPTAGFVGADSFTYQDTNSAGTSNTATVTLNVQAAIPTAANDSYPVNYQTALAVTAPGVLGNDSANGSSITPALVSNVSHGTLTLSADGSFTYTPTAGFVGADSFTYQDTNSAGTSNTATVTLNVQTAAPTALNDAFGFKSGIANTVTAPGVLGNDSTNGSPTTPALVTNVSHGTLVFNADGSFTYTPTAGFVGTDSFTYQDTNAGGTSSIATVTLSPPAVLPTAHGDGCTIKYQTARTVPAPGVLLNDTSGGATITAVLVSNPTHGTVTLHSDGSYTYTPTTGYIGTDSFTYQAVNSAGHSNTASVVLTVVPIPPAVHGDGCTIKHNTARTVPAPGVLLNDTSGGATITAVLVSNPTHGTVTLNSDGSYTYTPNTGYSGTDTFTYRAVNSAGQSSPGSVVLTVL